MMSLDMSRDRIEPEMAGLRLGIVFWLSSLSGSKDWEPPATARRKGLSHSI
jgi:hypothetical protein